MRGAFLAVLGCVCCIGCISTSTVAAPAVPASTLESTGLRSIAGWLKLRGVPGYVGADVADAMGIPRAAGAELLDALQRGFREDEVLRIAQFIDGEYMLFMVQQPDEVQFYLSTVRGGLRKALVSMPGREAVAPLDATEAEANFRREVLYWEDKVAR
jgi:hypothetical protein